MLPGTAVVHTCYSSYIHQYTRYSTWYILLPMLLLLLAAVDAAALGDTDQGVEGFVFIAPVGSGDGST